MIKHNHRYFDNHRKTSWLYFDDNSSRECYMRGGICFPIKYQSLSGIGNNGYTVIDNIEKLPEQLPKLFMSLTA